MRELLKHELGFDELFSKWLAENLHGLKEASVKLLESLDSESYQYVRLSTIAHFDYDKQLGLFKSRARNIFMGLQNEKRNMIEPAITLTSDKGIMLDMDALGKVILCVRDLPKMTRNE